MTVTLDETLAETRQRHRRENLARQRAAARQRNAWMRRARQAQSRDLRALAVRAARFEHRSWRFYRRLRRGTAR